MKKEQKLKKIDFRDYYSGLPDNKKEEVRNAILTESGMSYTTFYYKLRNKPLELKMIDEITKLSTLSE